MTILIYFLAMYVKIWGCILDLGNDGRLNLEENDCNRKLCDLQQDWLVRALVEMEFFGQITPVHNPKYLKCLRNSWNDFPTKIAKHEWGWCLKLMDPPQSPKNPMFFP